MAVLGRQAILQAIDDGLIAITPFNADHVGPASVDLTLGSTFRVFRKVHEVIEVAITPTTANAPTSWKFLRAAKS